MPVVGGGEEPREMPIDWSLQVVEAHVRDAWGGPVEAQIVHLAALDFEPRENVLDALMDAMLADFPVVLVGDDVACVGAVNLDAIRTGVEAYAAQHATDKPA